MQTSFLNILEDHLAKSTGADRRSWAREINERGISQSEFFPLLSETYPVRSRFIWLLSDIAEADPVQFGAALPDLFVLSQKIRYTPLDQAFARLWLIAGVPTEQEGLAIDHLFTLLQSSIVKVSIKYNALRVLQKLLESYPELTDEFLLVLEDQKGRHTATFDKMIKKTIQIYRKPES